MDWATTSIFRSYALSSKFGDPQINILQSKIKYKGSDLHSHAAKPEVQSTLIVGCYLNL